MSNEEKLTDHIMDMNGAPLFTIQKETLMNLLDPKNPSELDRLGSVNEISKQLKSDLKLGINNLFQERKEIYGDNQLPQAPVKSFLSLVWDAFHDKILILLSIAAIVSLGIGIYLDVSAKPGEPKVHWIEGFAILLAVFVVVFAGSINNFQKEKQFRKLNAKKEDRSIKVIRNGKQEMISIFDLLVGDLVLLEPGDVLPADGLVVDAHNLACDESGATGESDAIKKGTGHDPFLLSGTKVLEGVGKMLTIAVGSSSFHGKTMLQLQVESTETPLELKLGRLTESIAKIGASVSILMLLSLLIKYLVTQSKIGFPPTGEIVEQIISIIIQAITIIVVAVPEGLPMAVTVALAYATTRMLKDNNLVRVLAACETMGNATTICSDKTGTLTENRMTVVQGEILDQRFDNEQELTQLNTNISKESLDLLATGISANSSAFENQTESGVEIIGSKTEVALLQFIKKFGYDFSSIRKEPQITDLFPFSSAKKTMATIVQLDGTHRVFLKGASEIVVSKCDRYIDNESKLGSIGKDKQGQIASTINHLACQALRTIALAYKDLSSEEYELIDKVHSPDSGYIYLGIVGIEDPLRQGVNEAVRTCQKAGIVIRMVTGDNILTAQAIARKAGILMKGGLVMEGPQFRKLNDEELTEKIPKLQVLARSSPLDKQILVKKLREMNEVVAVTGDGTNDGPALKAADVGFSMGIAGTEVAKEASSIVLMDDNFTSIVKAVSWGRAVNDNVKKFLQFQLTVNVTAVVLAFVTSLIDSKQHSVLTAVQLLWVNLLMDTMAALALATDDPQPEILERFPEPKDQSIITFDMWRIILSQSAFQICVGLVLFLKGATLLKISDDKILRSFIFNTFVFMQIFNEFNCRILGTKKNIFKGIFKNKYFLGLMIITLGFQIIIIFFGGQAFKTVPIPWNLWLISIGIGMLSLPIAFLVRLIPGPKPTPSKRTYLTKERLQWQSAITQVKTQLSVFSALRKYKRPSIS